MDERWPENQWDEGKEEESSAAGVGRLGFVFVDVHQGRKDF